jgi:hypothetical protein
MALWCWNAALAGLGLAGQYLAGRRSLWGWVVGLLNEALWIAYAAWTEQWLFAASAVAYGGVYLRNLRAWRAQGAPARRDVGARGLSPCGPWLAAAVLGPLLVVGSCLGPPAPQGDSRVHIGQTTGWGRAAAVVG